MTTVASPRQRLKVVCPHDCPDTCVMTVDVEDGRAVGLGGDPDHRFTFVATGDSMDHRTSVTHVFIDGTPQSLETRHTRLYKEF